eukprot:GGOE01055575.1.p2 GENE.GGOE01055575.1~~GGOE01055575.1.p2  ORF type:complete len:151 (-),score=18.99 GGOE01055575.1:41-493(-)
MTKKVIQRSLAFHLCQKNCVELKGPLHLLLQHILRPRVRGLRKVIFEGGAWATVAPTKLDEAVGRYAIFERELVISKAPEGSPGNAILSGGFVVLFQCLERELSVYGVIEVLQQDHRFFAKAASQEFIDRMQQRGSTTLKGVKIEFTKLQ